MKTFLILFLIGLIEVRADISLIQSKNHDSDYSIPPPPFDEEFNYPKDNVVDVHDNAFSSSSDSYKAARYTNPYHAPPPPLSQSVYQVPNYDYRVAYTTNNLRPQVYEIKPQQQYYQRNSYNQPTADYYNNNNNNYYYTGRQQQPQHQHQHQPQVNYANVKAVNPTFTSTRKDSTGYHYDVPKNPLII